MNPREFTREPHKVWRDFGWGRMPKGHRRLLSWNQGTGELTFYGLTHWDRDETLATFATDDEVRAVLDGWEQYHDTPDGLAWLTRRLENAGKELGGS